MAIKFKITIKRFGKKKGKKAPPKIIYTGDVVIKKRGDVVEVKLKGKSKGKKKKLPVTLSWDSHADQVFCLAKKDRFRFVLKTAVPGGGDISSFSVGGQNADTGKFINWSASILVSEKS